MRTRQSRTVALTAFIGVLLATIVALAMCAGPGASADAPAPSTTTADPSPGVVPGPAGPGPAGPAGSAGHSGSKGDTGKPGKRGRPGKPAPAPTTTKPHPQPSGPKPSSSSAKPPEPARLGTAADLPAGTTYSVSEDGQTFTVYFSTLEATNGERTLELTVPLSGDTDGKTLRLQAAGYSFTDPSTSATLTVKTKGQGSEFGINEDTDDDYVFTHNVHLGAVTKCTIKLTIKINNNPAVRDGTGTMDVATLDGLLR
jgi:hypothetical protein